MSRWGVKSAGGVVTIAKDEEQAREWDAYEFKSMIGPVGEKLAQQVDGEWVEVAA